MLDSLAAAPHLRERGVTRLLDLGSGGGFPGIPLAAALGVERALLVDSVAKKVRFLQAVVEATGLADRVAAEPVRAEALARDPRDRGAWPCVTARAVASLAELVELALPLLAPGGVLVAWKREPLEAELDAAAPALAALRAGRVTVVPAGVSGLADHRLVIVERGGRGRRQVPARPRGAAPEPDLSMAPALPSGGCGLPSCPTSTPTCRPWTRSSRRSHRSTGSGSWATSWATGRTPTRWSPACATSGRSGSAATTTRRRSAGARSSRSTSTPGGPPSGPARRSPPTPARGCPPCPETLELEGFLLVHGSPRDPTWEYITSTPVARAAMTALGERSGLHGHTHLPVAFIEEDGRLETMSPGAGSRLMFDGRRVLLNPGSVGQPRDGIPTAGWMLLDTDAGSATWRRTSFDIEVVQAAMVQAALPERLVARLAYGL